MKAVGVIVEYNPFHNGHKYHLDETKRKTNPDCTIAVMSGNFLQRGEPALVSKWARTKMALEAGIDIVIELPYAFATQKAENFANGAISLLSALHCEEVCFGSENGSIDDFQSTVEFMKSNQHSYDHTARQYLKEGYSYPKAASLAYSSLTNHDTYVDLSKPNNILGYHYVKAIHDQNSSLKAETIMRTSAGYHDETFSHESIASATSIRKTLFSAKKNIEEIQNYLPVSTSKWLSAYFEEYQLFHRWEDYFTLLKYKLLTSTPSELATIYEAEEGIENRLLTYISESTSFKDFMEKIKTKRYTWTRLQRLCVHILTNTTKEQLKKINENPVATYIRLLGMSQKGQSFLNYVKKDVELPILSKATGFSDDLFTLDQKAAQTYVAIFPEPLRTQLLRQEYAKPPIRFNEEQQEYL
ncbi:nucleotidyltransferase [Fredinandcohnia sp. QZ13]|uniref:nucleotidyltransferase n=1 Tax=Fredinandcohnia sp. QZ13 TaxID=3073144 RepID=UPI0028534772|nr:nucleotidyltransferase [Fredinandcohnia sp. QZ13]MDR4886611.1 nucleotidyltransferase [Fredinandcohnia sp. QZ13]